MAWTVLIPVKRLDGAKTRLVDAGVPTSELALAFATDTVSAVLAAAGVDHVVVVTDDPQVSAAVRRLGADVSADPGLGLNAAVVASRVDGPTAALPSDLPALTPGELAAALAAAAGHPRAFVADAEGIGTTLLTAREHPLDPHYGPDSAAAHEKSGVVRLRGDWPGLARDVDTPAGLATARLIGLGRATSALLGNPVALCPR